MTDEIIEAAFEDQVAFLRSLVANPSDNPPGDCADIAAFTADRLRARGLTVEEHPVPEPFLLAAGMRSVTNLVVRERFGAGGPVIALNAHGDVVPPGEGWTAEPYGGEIRGDALYGRGAAVSKSDFATYVFALEALKQNSAGLNGTVELHLTFDEEAGGFVGPKWLLEQGLSQPDFAISAGFAHAVTTAHNGCLHLEVIVRGRQAHAAMPELGIDALEAATPILAALYRERERLSKIHSGQTGIGSPTLTVGLISGGTNTNVVPERVALRLDRRLIPEEAGETVEAALTELTLGAATTDRGAEVECRRIMLAEPLRPVPGSEKLVAAIQAASQACGGPDLAPTGVPLYTDARHYAEAGVPTICYGAGPASLAEANAHGADEHVRLSDLKLATRVVARALRDLLRADRASNG
ncbi:MAG: M20/M25/M40 family metallo-hydrolase [Pseudomonadota bacterium]